MSKKELTKKRICFVLYGYKIDVLTLFDKLLPFYEEKNYPLKSVRYDFLKNKNYRDEKLSILKFQEKRKNQIITQLKITVLLIFFLLISKLNLLLDTIH